MCGYERPTRQQNATSAGTVLGDIDMRSGWALYADPTYEYAGGGLNGGQLKMFSYYRVIAHAYTGGELWLQVCENIDVQNPIGWIKAESLTVETGELHEINLQSLIGREYTVVVSSGRVRAGAGNYNVVGYVHKGDKVYVSDAAIGTDGKVWVKISSSSDRWISGGLVGIK